MESPVILPIQQFTNAGGEMMGVARCSPGF